MAKMMTTLAKSNNDSSKIQAYYKLPVHDHPRLPVWLENRVTSEVHNNRLRFTIVNPKGTRFYCYPNEVIMQPKGDTFNTMSVRDFELNWTPIGIDLSIQSLDPTMVNEAIAMAPQAALDSIPTTVVSDSQDGLDAQAMDPYVYKKDQEAKQWELDHAEQASPLDPATLDSETKSIAEEVLQMPNLYVTQNGEGLKFRVPSVPVDRFTVTLSLDWLLTQVSEEELLVYFKGRFHSEWDKQWNGGYDAGILHGRAEGRRDKLKVVHDQIIEILAKEYDSPTTE